MTNLLRNPSFEQGYYHHQDRPEMVIPNEWQFWFADNDTPWIDRQGQNWDPPECVVWHINDAPQDERSLFFLDGQHALKIFGGWKAIWFKLSQDVTKLTAKHRYRFTVPIFPDLVHDYGPDDKKWAPDPLSGEVRLIAQTGDKILAETDWIDGRKMRFGKMNFFSLEFTTTTTKVTLTIECRGRWGIVNNGWFIDRLQLEPLGADDSIAPTIATDRPTSTASLPTEPAKPVGDNLLRNPSFENGYSHHQNRPELAIPNEWEFWFADNDTPFIERQDQNWDPPEIVVWNIKDAPEHEKSLFFREGSFCLKGFGGWKAIWFKLSQKVNGLTPGERYRLTVPIFPDLVVEYAESGKIFASDVLSGEVRLSATEGETVKADSGYLNGGNFRFGQQNELTFDFEATATSMTLAIECRGRWGLVNNGWFLDALSLHQLSAPINAETPKPIEALASLLTNGDFSLGQYLPFPTLPRLQVPNHWSFWHAPRTTELLPGQTERFREPNAYIATPRNAFPDDMDAFIDGVSQVYAVIGPWRAIWWALAQKQANLAPGRRYRLSAHIFPDPVAFYSDDETKHFDTSEHAGEIWLRADNANGRSETLFTVNRDLAPGRYTTLTHEFTAAPGETTIIISVRSRKPLVQNAYYIAEIALHPL